MSDFLRLKRANLTLAPGARLVKTEVYADWIEGTHLLEQARHDAERLRVEARAAYTEAKRRGYQDGLAESQARTAEQFLQAVAGTIDHLGALEQKLAALVNQAVRKIVHDFDDEALVLSHVRNALNLLRRDQRVNLRVAPQSAAGLSQKLAAEFAEAEFISVTPDNRVAQGNCILETDMGVIDARIDTQLEAIRRAIESRFGVAATQRVDEVAER